MKGGVTEAQAAVRKLTGFQALDLDNPAYEDLNKAQAALVREQRSLFHQAFIQNEAGRKVLDIIIEWSLMRPVADPSKHHSFAYFREGQNDIVRSILAACDAAEKGD